MNILQGTSNISSNSNVNTTNSISTTINQTNNAKPPLSPSVFKITSTQIETARTICITRNDTGYGFTLSRYVIYPNDDKNQQYKNITYNQNNDAQVKPIEIVFIKHVRSDSVAYLAGLREGDRPIKINNVSTTDKTYSQIITLIENSGKYLELVVIPSETQSQQQQQQQQSPNNPLQPLTSSIQSDNKQSKLVLSSDDFDNSNHEVYNINFKSDRLSSPSSISSSTLTTTTFNSPTQTISPPTLQTIKQNKPVLKFHSSSPPPPLPPPQPPPSTNINNNKLSTTQTTAVTTTAQNTGFFDYHKMSNYKPEKLSPLTQLKLRRLQQSLIEQYTKEELNELGIVIPNYNDNPKHQSPRKASPSITNLQERIIKNQQRLLSERNLSTSSVSSSSSPQNINQYQQQMLNKQSQQQQQQQSQQTTKQNQSPALFSQYIESVHKALNESYPTNYSPFGEHYPNYFDQTRYATNQQIYNIDSLMPVTKRLVQNRKQLFEQPQVSIINSNQENIIPIHLQQQQQHENKFEKQNTNRSEQVLTTRQQLSQYQQLQQQQNSTLVPINFINSSSSALINQQQNKYGDLKKLMQTGIIETIAERAAHFEDVDPDKYNRIKNKYLINDNSSQFTNTYDTYQLNLNHLNTNTNLRSPQQSSFYRQQQQQQQQQQDDWKYERPHIARYYTASNLITNENMNIPNDEYLPTNSLQQPQKRSITSSSSPPQLNSYSNQNNSSSSSLIQSQQQQQQQKQITNNLVVSNNKTSSNYTNATRGRRLLSSDAVSLSSDSEGASSPPSSPRKQYYQSKSSSSSNSKQQQKPPDSPTQRALSAQIIRQHSYLNAVRTNDDFALYTHKFNPQKYQPNSYSQQQQSQQQQQQQQKTSFQHYNNYSYLNNSNKNNNNYFNNSSNSENFNRNFSNTNNKLLNNFIQDDSYDIQDEFRSTDQEDLRMSRQGSKKQSNKKHSTSTSTMSPIRSPISDDEPRRNSNFTMTSGIYSPTSLDQQQFPIQKPYHQQHQEPIFSKPPQPSTSVINKTNKENKMTTPQPSRNTSIKKLKSFFGEKTPIVLQAVENKNIIASDTYLNSILETIKEGVLNCKILLKDGKRSNDRSWKPAWAVLKKNGALFLCKEKKDNVMVPSVDSYPINLKSATIYVAHDYLKRRNVFKVITLNGSEYLFQTMDNESMNEWINEMTDNSFNNEKQIISSSSSSMNQQQQLNLLNDNNRRTSADSYLGDISRKQSQQQVSNNSKIKSSSELITPNNDSNNTSSDATPLSALNQQLNRYSEDLFELNANISPLRTRKDSSPRRDSNNRKWVRQVTRRIRDFMNSAPNVDSGHEFGSSHDYNHSNSLNFGIPLSRCEASSISDYIPVVVEICTRLIELHIIDEGIYRKVGQKVTVNSLRAQINKGVKFIEVTDTNWDNPHVVVSLLKCFLNELPDSLITKTLYTDFIQVCRIDHHHIRLMSIRKLLRQLPIHNFETMKYLCSHLRKVAASYQQNKMTIKNISISFSQSIIRLNEASCETIKSDHIQQTLLVELLLTYYEWVFDYAEQFDSVPNEARDVESQLMLKLGTTIESTSFTEILSNILKALRLKWQVLSIPKQEDNNNKNQEQSRQSLNIQFKRDKNEILRNSKSVGSIKSDNKDDENNEYYKNISNKDKRNKSISVLSSLKDENIIGKNVSRIKIHAKSKRKSKRSQNANENENYTRLSETIREQIANFKELEKQNQIERERLDHIMKELDSELIIANINIVKDNYSSTDSSSAIDYKRTNSFLATTHNRPFNDEKINEPKPKVRRRHTISSVDHLIENKENMNERTLNIKHSQLPQMIIDSSETSHSLVSSTTSNSVNSAMFYFSDSKPQLKSNFQNNSSSRHSDLWNHRNVLQENTRTNFQYESLI